MANLEIPHDDNTELQNMQKALLNILEDHYEEKKYSENIQRAVINILEDYGVERIEMENTQRSVVNILEDFSDEKKHSENVQRAVINILSDYGEERTEMENTQRSVLNILEDFSDEKKHLENTQRAVINILSDYSVEKQNMENTQRSVLNILEDFSEEKSHLENTQSAVINILSDYSAEKVDMENTQHSVLNILEDFSEEKNHLENSQRALVNILDDYAGEKNKAEALNKDLTAANKELEQFAFIASHDLQEPLRTITSFVGVFEKKYAGKLDENAEQYLRFIVTATFKMRNLIEDLLGFSRIGRNILLEPVDFNDALRETLVVLYSSIKESHAKITSNTLPVLTANKTDIIRLFQNLISNAIKFRKKDVACEITITAEEEDSDYVFAVKDNGIGIEERFFKKLFVIFQRLHSVAEYPGTGIGLATCKKIVDLHGGKIWVTSKVNEGSTFFFTIAKNLK
jgi:signal transduction histidine kinase